MPRDVDRTPTHNTHLCRTVCSQARNAHTTCLAQELHVIFVRLKRIWSSSVQHVSSLIVLSPAFHHEHFLFLIHSSFFDTRTRSTIGTTRATPRTQNIPHISKLPQPTCLRHQESLWRENLQSGGNPRTTTPTSYEPKELGTVSRIEAYSGDPYQIYDVQEKVGEKDHRGPITEQVEELGEIGTAGLQDF